MRQAMISPMRRCLLSLGVVALACGVFACGGGDPPGRVLLIGIDGASPRVMEDLLARGELPHLAEIAASGSRGKLRSQWPLLSPRIWNSIATGHTPEKHGIVDFTAQEGPALKRLLLSTDRRTRPLWTIASAAERSVVVVNWWNTYPPERVRGAIVSDHLFALEIEVRKEVTGGVVTGSGSMMYPAELEQQLAETLRATAPPVVFDDPFRSRELPSWVDADFLSALFQQDALVARIAIDLEERVQPDLMMVLLTGIDRVSHVLWGSLEPPELYPEPLRFEGELRDAAATGLERYYQYTDALIGRLVEAYREEDLVVVVSDHGFEAGVFGDRMTGVHNTLASLEGVIFARGEGIPEGIRVHGTGIFDVAPTVLAWMELPVASDMDGQVVPFLRGVEIDMVETYDHLPVEHVRTEGPGAESELLEQLRALGYLE
jgi:predicted AlkP superfamily phosphohydrolase/phosphomutase